MEMDWRGKHTFGDVEVVAKVLSETVLAGLSVECYAGVERA